ncbi:MAG: glycosyltransferase [Planctomycetota bacterium]|nr:MAG: glycosyltransferase [Planctomycetota bacterium]
MNKSILCVFVKYPEPGKVKTRLGEQIGMKNAAKAYQGMVEYFVHSLKVERLPFILYFTPVCREDDFQKWLGRDLNYLPQVGDNLGQKLVYGFQRLYQKGFSRVMAIGSDTPTLPMDYLQWGLDFLGKSPMVIGPTLDGGYYLIGFQNASFTPVVFSNIPWSTREVFSNTLEKCRKLGIFPEILPYWRDVDYADEWERVRPIVERFQEDSS